MGKKIEIQDENETDDVVTEGLSEETSMDDLQSDSNADEDESSNEKDLQDQLSTAKQEAQDNYDRLLRLSADYENYKKRTSREMQDLAKYANERIIKELLTVVDNLERAMSAADNHGSDDPFVQGVSLTLNEMVKLLEKHHVEPITSLGEPFDPNFHQAMMQEEVDDQPPNTIVKEMQKGYMIHERLLRPALVSVSKAKSTANSEKSE